MEARYAFRKTPLLDECQVAPEIFEQVILRLYTFMEPFVKTFHGQVDGQHAKTSVCGLLSDVERKNIASIAYRFGQSRLLLQGFIGWHEWDDEPLRPELRSQVKTYWAQGDGVLGRVDELFHEHPRGNEMNQRHKGLTQLLLPGGHAAKLLEVMEEPLPLLASLVEVGLIVERLGPMARGR